MAAARESQPEILRIAHVFRAPLGGLFRHVVDLAAEQSARGHQVGVFFDSGARCERVDNDLARIPGGAKLGVVTCPIDRNPGLRDFAALSNFSSWLREIRPDVVHGHGSKGGVLARMAAWRGRQDPPIRAYTPHGGSFNYHPGTPQHRLYMLAERFMASRTDVFLFESAYIASRFDQFVGAKVRSRRVVANGIGVAEFVRALPDADAADLLYVGELREAKGIDTLLEALPIVARLRGKAPRAVLVGSGPDREILNRRAQRLGIADHVEFPGPMPIREAFKRGRTLVVPSRAESMPYVVLEAAGARVPMIANDVGGIPEIFGPYRDRLGPCDDPENLARRIADMLDTSSEEREERAADLAFYVAENFSIQSMVNSVMGGYREALSRRRPQPARAVAAAPSAY